MGPRHEMGRTGAEQTGKRDSLVALSTRPPRPHAESSGPISLMSNVLSLELGSGSGVLVWGSTKSPTKDS
jgi:hypothetical protein